jgi:hypothetical protein
MPPPPMWRKRCIGRYCNSFGDHVTKKTIRKLLIADDERMNKILRQS